MPYYGVNVNLRHTAGFLSEIQFHTLESFQEKMSVQDHLLYEKRRVLEPGTKKYLEILHQQFQLYEGMPVPAGIETIDFLLLQQS